MKYYIILSDSLSFWRKLFAQKLNISYVCSTTTFAFNNNTSKMMKQSFGEIMRMILGMDRINKKIKLLRKSGYDVKNFISMVTNDNNTNTIVYTSKEFDIKNLGYIPNNFQVENSVEQVIVLQNTDVFITHCGMNSVNESLYYGVPMALFPNHSEQRMVAQRVYDLGAGIMLDENKSEYIRSNALQVMNNNNYKESADKLAKSFNEKFTTNV